MAEKSLILTDFLTEAQIKAAHAIFESSITPAKEICEKVIQPNIAAINHKIGQENDPKYLAYACEYVFGAMKRKAAAAGLDEYIKEEVERGGVAWVCPEGHLGLFHAGGEPAKKWLAAGNKGKKFPMPKESCPGCSEGR